MTDTSVAPRPTALYVTHRVPYPPDKGDRIRNYHLLSWLSRRASVHLATLDDEGAGPTAAGALRALASRVAIVPLGRTTRWARTAWSLGTGRTASEGAFQSPALAALLRRWAGGNRYDVVLASASSLAPYLKLPELRGVPAVIDFVDVDSRKWRDYAAAGHGPRAWLHALEGRRLLRLERDATRWARGIVLVSEAEAQVFRADCDAANVYVVPNGVDLDYFRPAEPTAGSAEACVFVGALDYQPNIDGVCWFCRDVWPAIRAQRPEATLRLVGRRPVPAVVRLRDVPGVEVVGQVPDVRPYVAEASIVVVPLRLARGVQNKVLEAMAMGKAVVASPQSLAGLEADGPLPLLPASAPGEWVNAVFRLLGDPTLRERLGRDARRHVETTRRWDRCLEPFKAILGVGDEPVAAPVEETSWA